MQESCGNGAAAGLNRTRLARLNRAGRAEAAEGRGARNADRQQRDERQHAVGHGSLRAQQRDQNDDPDKSRRASVRYNGKFGERQM